MIQNLVLGVAFAAAPGPVSIEILRRGATSGFLPAFLVGLGSALADATLLALGYFGMLGFSNIPVIKKSIWILGALVLFYFGYTAIKSYSSQPGKGTGKTRTGKNSFITGFAIAISSPITIVWWMSASGTVLSSTLNAGLASVLLSYSSIILGIVIWFFALAILLRWGSVTHKKIMRHMPAVAGVAFIVFGLYFTYSGITL